MGSDVSASVGLGEAEFEEIYEAARRIARAIRRRRSDGARYQTTEILHSGLLKLLAGNARQAKNPGHALSIIVSAIRFALTDDARRRMAFKRGGGWASAEFVDSPASDGYNPENILAADEYLGLLAKIAPRAAQVFELSFFGACTVAEICEALDLATRTVERDLAYARGQLAAQLRGERWDGTNSR